MRTSVSAMLAVLCTLVLWPTAPRPCDAHPHLRAPPIELFLTVDSKKGEIVVSTVAEEPLLREGITWEEDAEKPSQSEALRWLNKRFDVAINGKVIPLEMRKVRPLMTQPRHNDGTPRAPTLLLRAGYPLDGTPNSVAVRWKDFDGIQWETEVAVPLSLTKDKSMSSKTLVPEEPQHIWHAILAKRSFDAESLAIVDEGGVRAPRPATSGATFASWLRWIGACLAVFALAWLLIQRPGTNSLPFAAGVAAAGLGLVLGLGVADRLASGETAPRDPHALPSEAGAIAIFDQLLTNIYGAFDRPARPLEEALTADAWARAGLTSEDEDAIFDLLAKSVRGPKLPEVYEHVVRSLILEDQGGAVCRVESFDLEARTPHLTDAPSGDRTTYTLDATWTMVCAVHHIGHTHRRRNSYAATFTIGRKLGGWKIEDFEVKRHQRESLDPPAEPPTETSTEPPKGD